MPNNDPVIHSADEAISVPMQDASLDIWDKKYRLKDKQGAAIDKTLDGTYQRVAQALSEVETDQQEHWYEQFLWALRNGAIPAGRIISNAGALAYKPATSTINCTVSGTIEDSMRGILEKNVEAGLTLKAGCGIGYEFSTLRPKGAYVSGAGALTSGPLSFMDVFDKMCFTVSSAGGRRGAQMATFNVHHPDVMEFIRAKREDGRLRQFNLSLLITDDFVQAVKDDGDWTLSFPLSENDQKNSPLDLDDPRQVLWRAVPNGEDYLRNEAGLVACKVYRTIPARRLWDVIMASTYDYAEPGFILIDQVNRMNNNWFCEDIRATNPCVTADTWVHTAQGPRQVSDLLGVAFQARVDGADHATGAEGFFKTARKPVLCLQTQQGPALRLTADHRVRRVTTETRFRQEVEWCAAGELAVGDRVVLHNHRPDATWNGRYSLEEGYLLGLLIGDGTLKEDKAVLSVWTRSLAINEGPDTDGNYAVMDAALNAARTLPHRKDFRGWQKIAGRNEYRLASGALRALAQELELAPGHKTITAPVEKTSSAFHRGLLRGLFDADGSVQGNQEKGVSVRLAQSNLHTLEAAQRMLLRLGINSTIYRNRRPAGEGWLPDGKGGHRAYPTQAQHELIISGDNLAAYAETVGFAHGEKHARLEHSLKSYRRRLNRDRFTAIVESINNDGEEDVYDVQVPGINTFDANGIHAHNCGEQPLPPYGSCLLGSVNLTLFVLEPFTDNARFDWERYKKVVAIFTRMLDNVVEINGLALPEQRQEIERKRRHGMGFLGLGSTMSLLKIPYGSPESVAFTEEISRNLAITGWEVGLELAKEKGPAPALTESFTVDAEMLRLRPEMAADGYKEGASVPGRILLAKYSRYMQQLAEEEPALVEALGEYGCRFTHHSSIAPTGTISLSLANNASNGIEPSFAHHYSRNIIREGRKSKEKVDVYSYELLAYRALVDSNATPGDVPDYFVVSENITPAQHVDVQAAAQRWVDSSISKTINVPTSIEYEAFKGVYLYAYERGLKGCTTFRFNPENFQGVLVRDEDLENTTYRFELADGRTVEFKGNEEIEYDGEVHTAANLYDALKEGYYGKL